MTSALINNEIINELKKIGKMENPEIKRRGSYFPNEHYCFDDDTDKLETFVVMLKNRGYYIGKDWHIRSKKGVISSKLMRNGYYMIGAQYD